MQRLEVSGAIRPIYGSFGVKQLIHCSLRIVRVVELRRMRWAGHVARTGQRRDVYRVWVGKPEGKRPPGDPGVDGRIILRWIFRKWDLGVWTGSIWLWIGTGGGHLLMRQWTFGFHKMRGISWLGENRLVSQGGLNCVEWVSKQHN